MNPGDHIIARLPGSPLPWELEVVDVVGDVVSVVRAAFRDEPRIYHLHELELVSDPFQPRLPPPRAPRERRPDPHARAQRVRDVISR